jgi:hypothetical protein
LLFSVYGDARRRVNKKMKVPWHLSSTGVVSGSFAILDRIPQMKRGSGGVVSLYENLVTLKGAIGRYRSNSCNLLRSGRTKHSPQTMPMARNIVMTGIEPVLRQCRGIT